MKGDSVGILGLILINWGCSAGQAASTNAIVTTTTTTTIEPDNTSETQTTHQVSSPTRKSGIPVPTTIGTYPTTTAAPSSTSEIDSVSTIQSSNETCTDVPKSTASTTGITKTPSRARGRHKKVSKPRIGSIDKKGPRSQIGRIRAKNGVN